MNSLKAILVPLIALATSSAWADLKNSDSTVCSPTIHFKPPASWYRAYISFGKKDHILPQRDKEGWITFSLADTSAVGNTNADYFFLTASQGNSCLYKDCVTTKGYEVLSFQPSKEGFTCKDFKTNSAEVWIQEHPDPKKAGEIYMTFQKPEIKDFYVFLPTTKAWATSKPIINEDGKERKLDLDPEYCGWYFRRYIDEPLPKNVVIYREDDSTKSGVTAEPISLDVLFDAYNTESQNSNKLYFVADEEKSSQLISDASKAWFTDRPEIEGVCSYELTFTVYDTDALLHGAFTCTPGWELEPSPEKLRSNACYHPEAKYPIVQSTSEVAPCIGLISGMVEDTLNSQTKKPKLTAKGKTCFGDKADEAFAAMFNPTPGINETFLITIPFNKALNGGFEFNSDYYVSPGTEVIGGFFPNEIQPTETALLSERLPAAKSKRRAEGPTFFCADNPSSETPDGLRTIHPTEGVPVSDLICNGPGWDGGINCDSLFVTGGEFSIEGAQGYADGTPTSVGKQITEKFGVTWGGDGWGWSCQELGEPEGWPKYVDGTEKYATVATSLAYRWAANGTPDEVYEDILTTGGRNQHFCMESHLNFRFRKGLKFDIGGDDDIWVYIGNKLAVDLGGSHLPAPGYVDLDKFMPNAKTGELYDLDIYMCDRRTTMSNFRINTNIAFEQAFPNESSDAIKPAVRNVATSSPFRIHQVAPRELSIITASGAAKNYVVLDMKGQVISAGKTSNNTHVKVPTSGSYIVKVGTGYKRVNVN